MNLTVIIPTRNRAEHVQRLVKDLNRLNCEIIVIDDYSEKPVVVAGAKVIRNSQRLGVGESRNIGCGQAKCGWLLLLDDDVVPSQNLASFIDELLPILKTKDIVGFRIIGFNTVGSRTVRAETSDQRTLYVRMLNIVFGVDISPYTGPSRFTPAPAMIIHSDFYASLGGYDSHAYGGNAFRLSSDLQLRAHKMGGRLLYVEDPFFEHLNIPGGHKKGHSENDIYYMRNQTIFAFRNGGPASIVKIAAFGTYMFTKGFRISSLVKGMAQGLSVVLRG